MLCCPQAAGQLDLVGPGDPPGQSAVLADEGDEDELITGSATDVPANYTPDVASQYVLAACHMSAQCLTYVRLPSSKISLLIVELRQPGQTVLVKVEWAMMLYSHPLSYLLVRISSVH